MILVKPKLLVFAVLVLLLVCPLQAVASDFYWTLTLQEDQVLTETIVTDIPELIDLSGGWQQQRSDTFIRHTEGWLAYNEHPDRLPIVVKLGNYVAIKTVRTELSPQAWERCKTFCELTEHGSGQISIEVPGFVIKAPSALRSSWPGGFAASWIIAPQQSSQKCDFSMTAVSVEVLPAVIIILLTGWGLTGIIYWRQVRRMERLIKARYSLDRVVRPEQPFHDSERNPDPTSGKIKNNRQNP